MIHYLDTQVIVWLCEKQLTRLTRKAAAAIEESDLLISPVVLLELQYLYEIHKILEPPQVLLNQLESQIGLQLCDHAFAPVIEAALFEGWTRDPFDRIIVAHAKANGYTPLITSDRDIRRHYSRSVW
ncbi:MAG TPA: PIN domain-containing protein [Bryobacteraceae bacterium]|nr:PIN domain-containing protein [Bryobacteraceae bacterium]